jgi:hypothetical protein
MTVEEVFELDDASSARIFKKKIAPKSLSACEKQEHPVAIITGGQPGAGKSELRKRFIASFQERGGCLIIDVDDLRKHHPKYQDFLIGDKDKSAASLTHVDAKKWSQSLLTEGIKGRRHLVIDQTSRDPDGLVGLGKLLRESGYQSELHMMAVNPAVSVQRIHWRYETDKAEFGVARFVDSTIHDKAVTGVLEATKAAEEKRAVDRVVLYDKKHNQIYENRLVKGEWVNPVRGKETMRAEQTRPLSKEEMQEVVDKYKTLSIMLDNRGAMPGERAEIANLARQVTPPSQDMERER